MRSQIQRYLGAFTPGTNTLLVPVWSADLQTLTSVHAIEQFVSNYAVNISLLANAGGRVFLLPSPPPLDWASTNAEIWALDQFLQTNFAAAR